MKNYDPNKDNEAWAFLRLLGFKPVSHYVYPYAAEMLGYIEPPKHLSSPIKTMIEVANTKVTKELAETFYRSARYSLAERLIIISNDELGKLSSPVRSLISQSKIEFFGREKIRLLLKNRPAGRIEDIVSAKRLIMGLDDLARQVVPVDLADVVTPLAVKTWEVFEDAVFISFKVGFNYKVRQYGKETLLERQPEGVVVSSNKPLYSFLYDCKSARNFYKMTVDDERAYVEYIENKRPEVENVDKANLWGFVVISPAFSGDLKLRQQNIYRATGVTLVCLKASTLQRIALWMYSMGDPTVKAVVNLREVLFSKNGPVVSDKTVAKYIQHFDSKYRKRY